MRGISPTFQAETISRRESGIAPDLRDHVRELVDVPAAGRRPRAPLVAVDRPELAVRVGPFVPDRDAVGLEVGDVRLAAQEPQELVHDRLRVHLLGREQREPARQVEAHLVAEHGQRAGAGAVVLAVPVRRARGA